ncbi:hypothetical protein TorRG33x02_240810 [Trema orientale]|uniref:Uncharacterized protein n=1 Tax=Trema orientale TaxID=63057 RepID=A0A2P5DV34_TREOI|nr:hypothetical protein TorRG33x02_240810 [Trema orientale]
MPQVPIPQREQQQGDIITPIYAELAKNISTTTELVQGNSDSSVSDSDASLITLMAHLPPLQTSTSSKKTLKKKSAIGAKKLLLFSRKSFKLASSWPFVLLLS